ncbi:MAG: ferrochelatase [Pseudomonadota bacterium]
MGAPPKNGLVLINLGSPKSPSQTHVRAYLREFLSDPGVLDMSHWERWLLLNLFVLPFRPKKSARAYASIWTEKGSPLLCHSLELAHKVQTRMGDLATIELAMNYGMPSIDETLSRLSQRGVKQIVVFPLFPQQSQTTTDSALAKVFAARSKLEKDVLVRVIPAFFDHPEFIGALAKTAQPILNTDNFEQILFSFHGLPEQYLRKADKTKQHCLQHSDCCENIFQTNKNCYRAQCFATARLVADKLKIPPDKRIVCFQSRMGPARWIKPYLNEVIDKLAQQGVKKIAVITPSFVADCLETLEELGLRAVHRFRAQGGEKLTLVPCLNSDDFWADAVVNIAKSYLG